MTAAEVLSIPHAPPRASYAAPMTRLELSAAVLLLAVPALGGCGSDPEPTAAEQAELLVLAVESSGIELSRADAAQAIAVAGLYCDAGQEGIAADQGFAADMLEWGSRAGLTAEDSGRVAATAAAFACGW